MFVEKLTGMAPVSDNDPGYRLQFSSGCFKVNVIQETFDKISVMLASWYACQCCKVHCFFVFF